MKIPDFNSHKFLVAKKQYFLELTENRKTLREIKFVTRKCPFHLAYLAEFPKFWANRFPFWKFNNFRRDFQETFPGREISVPFRIYYLLLLFLFLMAK